MELRDKTLLLMGGGAYVDGILSYKKEKGFKIVAVGRDCDSPISKIADVFYATDTQNVEGIIEIVNCENVDGIFVGSSEVNIVPAIEVSERTNAIFYVTKEQWGILADKASFKEVCRENGVPVVEDYIIPNDWSEADYIDLPYPLLIKPVDSSGARGMNACYSPKEFPTAMKEAKRWSNKGRVVVEKLIMDATEVFFQYTIQDGEVSLSSSFSKVFTYSRDMKLILPIFHMYPSRYIEDYYRDVHPAVIQLFRKLKIKDGCMTLQSFYKDGQFYVFEAGYRMGGAQNYILTDYQNGTNSLNYMINYALTGKMSDNKISERDNAFFKYPCCNYYVGLKPGQIAKMSGIDEVRKMKGVLNVTVMAKIGDVVQDTNALERICLRIHVVGKDKSELADTLVNISSKLTIVSTLGEDMQLEHLDRDRCMRAINESVVSY